MGKIDVPQSITIGFDCENDFVSDPNNCFGGIPLLYGDEYQCYYYDATFNEMWKIDTSDLIYLYNSPTTTYAWNEEKEGFICNDGNFYKEVGVYDGELEAGIFPLKDTQELRFNNLILCEFSDLDINLFTKSSDIEEIIDYIKEEKENFPYKTWYKDLDKILDDISINNKKESEMEV